MPLLADAVTLVDQLTEEGLVDYVKALARLTATIAKNPQAAAMHLITELESLVKPKLNEWAAAGGEDEKVAAAGAGMLAFGVQTGAMMASSACDSAAVRRMVAQALGTVISAALGSQEAKDELEEMIPFWSWLVMGEQVADLWEAADYYGSGKRTGELVVQIVGDFTILVPVVKGAQIAIKAVNGVTRASVRQALSKVGPKFTRKKDKPVENATKTITECKRGDGSGDFPFCFPKGTLVMMADDCWKPIESIREGDLVMADNPRDNLPPAARQVVGVHQNLTEQWCDVHVQSGTGASSSSGSCSGTVTATGEHPFWVLQEQRWIGAADLEAGMSLSTPDHSNVTVTSVELRDAFATTWNLTVEDCHSFYVKAGDSAVLVHNTKPGARVYVVYEVHLPNGKVYVGRCSLAWDGKMTLKKAVTAALDRRFARHHRSGKHLGFSRDNAKPIWEGLYDASDYNEKKKIYGTMRGVEHRAEQYWNSKTLPDGTTRSANRDLPGWKAPIGDNNPNKTYYLNKADEHGPDFCKKVLPQ